MVEKYPTNNFYSSAKKTFAKKVDPAMRVFVNCDVISPGRYVFQQKPSEHLIVLENVVSG